MNVPELKLPSSTSAVDSVSTSEEEADEDNDGDGGGSQTGSSSKCKTNSSSTDDTDEAEEPQELPTTPQEKLTEHHAKNYFNSTMGGKDLRVLFAMAIGCHS